MIAWMFLGAFVMFAIGYAAGFKHGWTTGCDDGWDLSEAAHAEMIDDLEDDLSDLEDDICDIRWVCTAKGNRMAETGVEPEPWAPVLGELRKGGRA